jgi:hypothetical protein
MVLNNYLKKRGTEYNRIVMTPFGGGPGNGRPPTIVIGGEQEDPRDWSLNNGQWTRVRGDGRPGRRRGETFPASEEEARAAAHSHVHDFNTMSRSIQSISSDLNAVSGEVNQIKNSLTPDNKLGLSADGYFKNTNQINFDSSAAAEATRSTRLRARYDNIPNQQLGINKIATIENGEIAMRNASQDYTPLEREEFNGSDDQYLDYKLKELELMLMKSEKLIKFIYTFSKTLHNQLRDHSHETPPPSAGVAAGGSSKDSMLQNRLLILVAFLLLALLLKQFNVL